MKNPISRLAALNSNAQMLAPFMGGYGKALAYLVKTRGNNAALSKANYKQFEFEFRRADLPAIHEILGAKEYGFLENYLKTAEKPVIVDIGSHIGLFAIWALSINPQAQIYSIEASPGTYKVLAANANKAGASWTVDNKAAWGKNEMIRFANESGSTMSHRVDSKGGVEIATVTMSELAGRKIDLMKIDIEGAEESFLTAANVNLKDIGSVVIEIHPNLCNTDKVMDVLKSGFTKIENIKQGLSSKPLLYCRN